MRRYDRTKTSQGPKNKPQKTDSFQRVPETKKKPPESVDSEGFGSSLARRPVQGDGHDEPSPDTRQESIESGRAGGVGPGEGEREGREPFRPLPYACHFCGRKPITWCDAVPVCERHVNIRVDSKGRINGFKSLQYAIEHRVVTLPPGYVELVCDRCRSPVTAGPWREMARLMSSAAPLLCVECVRCDEGGTDGF